VWCAGWADTAYGCSNSRVHAAAAEAGGPSLYVLSSAALESELHIRAALESELHWNIGIRAALKSELHIRAALESELHWNIGIRASYQSYISELSLKLTS